MAMRHKTYNNIMKAQKLIMKKGYSGQESLDLAVKVFDRDLSIMPAEWHIDKILSKEEYEREYSGYMGKKED